MNHKSISIKYIFRSLEKADQSRYIKIVFANLIVALLELIGIIIFTVAISAFLGGSRLISLVKTGSGNAELLNTILDSKIELLLFAIFLIVTKGILSVFLIKKTYLYLADLTHFQTKRYLENLSNTTWQVFKKFESSKISQSLIDALKNRYIGVLGNFTYILCEISIVTSIFIVLFIIDPFFFIIFVLYFFLVILLLYKKITSRAYQLGSSISKYENLARKRFSEFMSLQREVFTLGKLDTFKERFLESQKEHITARAAAEINHVVPKYYIEITSMLGLCLFLSFLYIFRSYSEAIASGSVYIFGLTRLLPSFIRLQAYWAELSKCIGSSDDHDFILKGIESNNTQTNLYTRTNLQLDSTVLIKLKGVNFQFPNSEEFTLAGINLDIKQKTIVAIIGESGVGKSTLCEILSGLSKPTGGEISYRIDMLDAAGKLKPGSVVYLPQDSFIFSGSVFSNISLCFQQTEQKIAQVNNALRASAASEFVQELELGMNTKLGDGGFTLSGGQVQRILLARTLYANPSVVILDEPLSGIDEVTQVDIESYVLGLKQKTAIIVVTHDRTRLDLYDEVFEISKSEDSLRRIK